MSGDAGPPVGRGAPATIRGVVFVDVVGSTALRSRLGEVRADRLRRHHDEILGRVVDEHGGVVRRWTGDGIKASFTSASAALAAALDVQRAVRRYRRRADAVADLEVRVGVSAGEVTVEDDDDHGVAVIEGARIEDIAVAGEVLATDLARRLGRRRVEARFEPVGARTLKGLDEPVEVVRVVDARPDEVDVPLPKVLAADDRFPLVGRTSALAAARERWRSVEGGRAGALVVAAPPGLGKSRLVAQVASAAHADGALVLAGGCDPDLDVPYQPFTDAFGEVAELDDAIARAVAAGTGPLGPLFPAGRAGRADGFGPSARHDLFTAVTDLLGRLAAPQPVVLVLEDLHWATGSTANLVRHLLQDATGRVLVIGTLRADEVGPSHPVHELLTEVPLLASVTRLDLDTLDVADVAELVASGAPDADDVDVDAFAARVCAETQGSPFFVCEILGHLTRTGELAGIVGGDGGARLPVPDAVRDIVGHRIGRLPGGTAELLASAALVGQAFDLAVLVDLAGLLPEQVLMNLETAERAALVHEVGPGRFAFVHDIVRTTLLDDLGATRRVLLHRRIAEAIEATRPDEHDELARHWLAAQDERRATEHVRRAANRDLEALAYESAAERFAQVIDHHARQPPEDRRSEARAWLGLAVAERAIGREVYLDHVVEAGRRARHLDDVETMVDAAMASLWPGTYFAALGPHTLALEALAEDALDRMADHDPRRVPVLANLAAHIGHRGDDERTARLLDEALLRARREGDRELVGRVLIAEHLARWSPGTFTRRREIVVELQHLAAVTDHPDIGFFAGFLAALGAAERCDIAGARRLVAALDGAVRASRNEAHGFLADRLAVSLDVLACVPDAQERVDGLMARHDGTHSDTAGTWALQTGSIAFREGRSGDLLPTIRDMVEGGSNIGPIWRAPYGLALYEVGDLVGAERELDATADAPRDYFWVTLCQTRSEVAVRLGRRDVVAELYADLLPHRGLLGITASGSLLYGLVETTLGRLALALDELEVAIDHLRSALACAEAIVSPFDQVRAGASLASALLRRSGPGDAEESARVAAVARSCATAHGFAGELALLARSGP